MVVDVLLVERFDEFFDVEVVVGRYIVVIGFERGVHFGVHMG
ncbi:MAG: hypothetical protein O7C59_04340 [Rickettsia endosymbiont of Ixodes persulcatus]|nr:hypothetical protein [Rickettsia endosymbiont of Ixodes persulcatus]